MCGIMEIMGNYLHFIFILFHGYRRDTLPMCRPRAPDSKDNSVHTIAIPTPSSDSASSILWDGIAFPLTPQRALRRALRWVLLQAPPRTPRHPSTDQAWNEVFRWWWSPPHFYGGAVVGSRCLSSSAFLWALETRALSLAGCISGMRSGTDIENMPLRHESSLLRWSGEMRSHSRIPRRGTSRHSRSATSLASWSEVVVVVVGKRVL